MKGGVPSVDGLQSGQGASHRNLRGDLADGWEMVNEQIGFHKEKQASTVFHIDRDDSSAIATRRLRVMAASSCDGQQLDGSVQYDVIQSFRFQCFGDVDLWPKPNRARRSHFRATEA
jgi:hypothetical protein